MEELLIIGSGGFAKEVYSLVQSIGAYRVVAFVDLNEGEDILFRDTRIPVISETNFFENYKTSVSLAVGIGTPKIIRSIAEKYKGYNFPNLIHPTAVIEQNQVSMGAGNIITANTIFTIDIQMGDFNIFNLATTVGHDVRIGNFNVFNPAVNISGGVKIGSTNLMGVGSIILQYLSIANNSVIGASALVTKDVVENAIMIGIPAKNTAK